MRVPAASTLLAACLAAFSNAAMAFTPEGSACFTLRPSFVLRSAQDHAQSSDDSAGDDGKGQDMQPFFEETALVGKDRVRKMSVEERTRRAMLAEAVEDRLVHLYDDLENRLGENGALPESAEEREEMTTIAKQIKLMEEEYKTLVSGGAHPML